MKTLWPSAALVLALLLSPGPAPRAGEEEGEWSRPYPVYLPGCEPQNAEGEKTVVSVRLMREDSHWSRVFVPHGVVSFHTEECHPTETDSHLLVEGRGTSSAS